MAEKRSGEVPVPGGKRSPVPGSGARRAEGSEGDERFGPLLLGRYVKDDGRALILYARAYDAGGERRGGEQP